MNHRRVIGTVLATVASLGLLIGLAEALTGKTVPLPRPRPNRASDVPGLNVAAAPKAAAGPLLTPNADTATPISPGPLTPSPHGFGPAGSASAADVAALKRTLDAARRGRGSEASEAASAIRDPLARKLAEWGILRGDDNSVGFRRYMAFIEANPSWPSLGMLRRRAEAMLWQERESATTRAYFAAHKPLSAKGRFALARVLLAEGRQREAQALVREGWRGEGFSEELENQVLETFGELLTSADIKARMDARLYTGDIATANRMARRLGGAAPAVVKARLAAAGKAENAADLVAALPEEVRDDPGVIFARIQVLRRTDKVTEAAHLMVRAPRDPALIHNTDEWWVERRLLSRKLLDHGDARTAYIIARDAAPPAKENYRVEHQFTAGWIAFRFLGDERAALAHFAQIPSLTINPIALSRAGYWQGRVFEALGRVQEARAQFEYAAKYPTAYYGQLARARLGRTEVALKRPESFQRGDAHSLELVRALELLYTVDARELVIPLVIDVAEHAVDSGALAAMAEITARHNDARAMLLLGKTALGRGLALDHYAFPTIGVPQFTHVGPEVDRTVVYSIVRQESQFNQKTVSTANALGLMQVTPEAGREVARKYGARYDQKRLLSDPTYNTQMGAAEIGELVRDYSGCYVLSFAAYNAGRGRVREWIDRYGDPRDPKVDPVDWVERIPFSETRNYVQRVVENLQVYRVRFGAGHRLMSEADLRGNPR